MLATGPGTSPEGIASNTLNTLNTQNMGFTGGLGYNVFEENKKEKEEAKNSSKNNLVNLMKKRATLRRGILSGAVTTGNKDNDKRTVNTSTLVDATMQILVDNGVDPSFVQDKYGSSEGNLELINRLKSIEGGQYSYQIESYINGDTTDLTGTLSGLFPVYFGEKQAEADKSLEVNSSEDGWLKKAGTNMLGYMPKVAESANDIWNMIKIKTGATDERSVQFGNYLYEKYGKNVDKVSSDQLDKDYKEFMALEDKSEYTPTVTGAIVKGVEGVADTIWTLTPGGAIVKGAMSAAAATPYLEYIPQALGTAVGGIGRVINTIPGLSNIRDSLSESEKQERDAFVGGLAFAGAAKGTKAIKNVKASDIKTAFETSKTKGVTKAVEELNSKIEGKSVEQLTEQKSEISGRITQPKIETAKSTEAGLDVLSQENRLSKIKTTEDLSKAIDETISELKKGQDMAASESSKKISQNDLVLSEEADLVGGGKQKTATTPVTSILDTLIDYYKDVDSKTAIKYKSYKTAIENGTLTLKDLLNLRREANSRGQDFYNNKNLLKDTKAADKFESNMKGFNKLIDKLDINESIRDSDAKLSTLYSLRDSINTIKSKAFEEQNRAGTESKFGGALGRLVSKLSFGTTNLLGKFGISFLQEALFKKGGGKLNYTEISNNIPNLVKEYTRTINKINKAKTISEANTLYEQFASKRGLDSVSNAIGTQLEGAKTQTHAKFYGQQYDEAIQGVSNLFNSKNEED